MSCSISKGEGSAGKNVLWHRYCHSEVFINLKIFLSFDNPVFQVLTLSSLFYSTIHIVDHERVAYCIAIPSFDLKSFNFSDKIYTHFSVEGE